jgi:hypothetical protein
MTRNRIVGKFRMNRRELNRHAIEGPPLKKRLLVREGEIDDKPLAFFARKGPGVVSFREIQIKEIEYGK